MVKNIEKEAHRVVEGGESDKESRQTQNPGDNRTPDKTIGQVEYADNEGGGEQRNKAVQLEPAPWKTIEPNGHRQKDQPPTRRTKIRSFARNRAIPPGGSQESSNG